MFQQNSRPALDMAQNDDAAMSAQEPEPEPEFMQWEFWVESIVPMMGIVMTFLIGNAI